MKKGNTRVLMDRIDKVRVIRKLLEEQRYDLRDRLDIALDRFLENPSHRTHII